MIYFEDEDYPLTSEWKIYATQGITTTLREEAFPYDFEVTLTVTEDAHIHELNREHRQIDKATDVLSFPMIDWQKPCDYEFLEEELMVLTHPETGQVILGDIVISMDHVYKQAEAYDHSPQREFTFLIVHSMLHLLGFDHENPLDEQQMIQEQKKIMQTIGCSVESDGKDQ